MSAAPLASDGCQGRRNALLNDAFKFPSIEVIEARKACFETEAACNQAREAYEAANRAEESANKAFLKAHNEWRSTENPDLKALYLESATNAKRMRRAARKAAFVACWQLVDLEEHRDRVYYKLESAVDIEKVKAGHSQRQAKTHGWSRDNKWVSKPQAQLSRALGKPWRTEVGIWCAPGVCYRLDLAREDLKICIEVDGPEHRRKREYDAERTKWLESKGWTVARIWNRDVPVFVAWLQAGSEAAEPAITREAA